MPPSFLSPESIAAVGDVSNSRSTTIRMSRSRSSASQARLRKHADYQRVYKASRKHFSPSMSYFFSLRVESIGKLDSAATAQFEGPRVGLTAGRVVGKAVERNRIKRRMREVVRRHVAKLQHRVDVILHPRRSVLTVEFEKLDAEVGRIFTTIRKSLEGDLKGNSPGSHLMKA